MCPIVHLKTVAVYSLPVKYAKELCVQIESDDTVSVIATKIEQVENVSDVYFIVEGDMEDTLHRAVFGFLHKQKVIDDYGEYVEE